MCPPVFLCLVFGKQTRRFTPTKQRKRQHGINEILRLHLNRFTHKMDNPEVPVDTMDADGKIITDSIQKIYHVNIVFQLQHDGDVEYHHFRITMTRNGVQAIDEI